jgi:hypothetical protein
MALQSKFLPGIFSLLRLLKWFIYILVGSSSQSNEKMSLGWQTESALVPRQGKAIDVDNKSMVALKALVYAKEQQQQQRKQAVSGGGGPEHGSSSSTDPNRKKRRRVTVDSKEHASKEPRRHNDEEPPDAANDDKVMKALKAKAEVYDMIHNSGSTNSHSNTAEKELIQKYSQSGQSLVNFRAKSLYGDKYRSHETDSDAGSCSHPIRRGMEDSQAQTGNPDSSKWAWSRGTKGESDEQQNEFEASYQSKVALQTLIENKMNSSVPGIAVTSHKTQPLFESNVKCYDGDEAAPTAVSSSSIEARSTVSEAGRVKSQGEKTLSGSAREYLDQIHHETNAERDSKKNQRQPTTSIVITSRQEPTTETAATESVGSIFDAQVVVNVPKSAKELRREMIRKQQQEKGLL